MEHRIGSRLQLPCEVELMRGDKRSGPFNARDVSHGGICVEGCNTILNSGNLVEMMLTIGDIPFQKNFRLRALVVHHSTQGVGLMWAGMDPEFHSELNQLRTQRLCATA